MTGIDAALEIVPLSPVLGAEVRGLDAGRPLGATTQELLIAAWLDHLVLVLRDQHLSDPVLLAFSRNFGALDPPGPNPYGRPFLAEFPEINVISNIVEDGTPQGNLGARELVWHADMTYIDRPPKAGILYALEIPERGGDTYFANMYAAYAALPADLKRRIEGRVAIHDATYNSAGMMRKGFQPASDPREAPGARHRLARPHPVTGRPSLFLGRRRNSYIVGLPLEESEALLDALWAHAAKPEFAMRHRWRTGDLLIWDNRCTLHRRDDFDPVARRRLHRTQIREDRAGP